MDRPLFRSEAAVALQSTISSAVPDARLHRSHGVTAVVVACAMAFVGMTFIKVSLGVTAEGVMRMDSGLPPVIAERSGLLTYVVSERTPIDLREGDTVARIRNLDLVTLRNAPNIDVSKAELERKRQRLLKREDELRKNHEIRLKENARMEAATISLSKQTQDLLQVHEREVRRQQDELERNLSSLSKGLITREQLDRIRNLLADREVEVRESRIRLDDLNGKLSQVRQDRAELMHDHDQEMLTLDNGVADIAIAMQAETELLSIEIRMPHNGTLVPRGFSAGEVVKAGDALFGTAAEGGGQLFEVDIPADRIGELREGLPVKIAIHAFPYFEYGFIDGSIELFSRVPNEQIEFSGDLPQDTNFRAVIRPDRASLDAFRAGKTLTPGMSATVHIRREKVAFWRLLLAPLLRLEARVSA